MMASRRMVVKRRVMSFRLGGVCGSIFARGRNQARITVLYYDIGSATEWPVRHTGRMNGSEEKQPVQNCRRLSPLSALVSLSVRVMHGACRTYTYIWVNLCGMDDE